MAIWLNGSMMVSKWPTPRRGDISLCRFPYRETPSSPGPEPRPVLVLDVGTDNRVMVCYGTGQAHHASEDDLSPEKFGVFEASHIQALGLHEATIFDLSRTVVVPYVEPRFACPNRRRTSPVLGTLKSARSLRPALFASMRAAGLDQLLPQQQLTSAKPPPEDVADLSVR